MDSQTNVVPCVAVQWLDNNGAFLYGGDEIVFVLNERYQLNLNQLRYHGGDVLKFHGEELLPDATNPALTHQAFPAGKRLRILAVNPPAQAFVKAAPPPPFERRPAAEVDDDNGRRQDGFRHLERYQKFHNMDAEGLIWVVPASGLLTISYYVVVWTVSYKQLACFDQGSACLRLPFVLAIGWSGIQALNHVLSSLLRLEYKVLLPAQFSWLLFLLAGAIAYVQRQLQPSEEGQRLVRG